MTDSVPRSLVIRLDYVAQCDLHTVIIKRLQVVKLDETDRKAEVKASVVSGGNVHVDLSVGWVVMNGVKYKVLKTSTEQLEENQENFTQSLNLGFVEGTERNPFVYVGTTDLKCSELEGSRIIVNLDVVYINSLRGVRIPRVRIFHSHEDPFSADITTEYTVVNDMPFPVRYVYLDLKKYVKGLTVEDEKGDELRFLTRQELREVFGSDAVDNAKEFYVIVDLREELRPGGSKTLKLVGTEEIGEEYDYVLEFELVPGITEGAVIKPPPGYEVVTDYPRDIVLKGAGGEEHQVFQEGETSSDGKTYAKVLGKKVDENTCVDAFLNSKLSAKSMRKRTQASGVVDVQFRAFYCQDSKKDDKTGSEGSRSDPTKYSVVIKYTLEIERKLFWDIFLVFIAAIIGGVYFQGLSVDLLRGSTWAYAFPIGALLGTALALLYLEKLSEWKVLLRHRVGGLTLSYVLLISFLFVVACLSLCSSIQAMNENLGGLSGLAQQYSELDFATLVVLEVAYALAEKSVKDTYREFLIYVTAVGLLSMVLLVPWTL